MAVGRVISKRIPVCPGRDSRYTIKHNRDEPGQPWWVYYEPPGGDPIPADDSHGELVAVVNELKQQLCGSEGGAFSLNEHGQVIARMPAPAAHLGNAVHAIGVVNGSVFAYAQPLLFDRGALDPRSQPAVGTPWDGPLCGTTYKFAAAGNPKPPSHNLDEIFVQVGDRMLVLSVEAGISSYPPSSGALATFLATLRNLLPSGGRFRVNEHGRAFTSSNNAYIGVVPLAQWFKALSSLS